MREILQYYLREYLQGGHYINKVKIQQKSLQKNMMVAILNVFESFPYNFYC